MQTVYEQFWKSDFIVEQCLLAINTGYTGFADFYFI